MAKIHFKYGAMNSGKSDTLIKAAYNYKENNLEILVIKPSIDVKGGDFIVSRAGGKLAVNISAKPGENIRKSINDLIKKNKIKKLSCVLVDEAQFLEKDQVDQLYEVAKIDNISVIAFGLRADFQTDLFTGSKRLFEIVDNIEKLPTMCACGSQAEINCRKNNGQYVFEGDKIAIDGESDTTYSSLCGMCYFKEKAKSQTKKQHSDTQNKRILKSSKEGNK